MEIKLLSTDFSNLRNKTILDYTDNQKVIEDIVGMRLIDKDEKEYYFDNSTPLMRAQHILNLSKKQRCRNLFLRQESNFQKSSISNLLTHQSIKFVWRNISIGNTIQYFFNT